MAFEQRPDNGTLFTNDKRTSANQPSMTGKLKISKALLEECDKGGDSIEIEISAWRKEGQKGAFLSLAARKPWEGYQSQQRAPQAPRKNSNWKKPQREESKAFEDDNLDKMPWDD